MRPLTRDDYLLLGIVAVAVLAGIAALMIVLAKLSEELRERGQRKRARAMAAVERPAAVPPRMAPRVNARVSVIR